MSVAIFVLVTVIATAVAFGFGIASLAFHWAKWIALTALAIAVIGWAVVVVVFKHLARM